jgi:Domain of unknown function (DUF4279)
MTKQRVSEVKCSLCILDFACPAETITQALGVEPTETWLKGDLIDPRLLVRHKQNGWRLQSPVNPINTDAGHAVDYPQKAIIALLELFADPGLFRRLPACKLEISCAVYTYTQRPGIALSAEVMSRIGQIGADLDFDIYDLSSTEEEQ